jgi:DNA-binding response OmpR family regulator
MTIMSVGQDSALLGLRNSAFLRAGHRVIAVSDIDSALFRATNEAVDAVVLCYTIPPEERQRFLATIRELQPTLKVCQVEKRSEARAA